MKDLLFHLTSNGRLTKLVLVSLGLFIIYKLIIKVTILVPLMISLIPIVLIVATILIMFYHRIFYLLFASHFIFLFLNSFVDIRLGIITLIFNLSIVIVLLLMSIFRNTTWANSSNGMLLIFLLWGAYCTFELINPNAVFEAWILATTYHFVYPIICAILVPLTIKRINHIYGLLILWSLFILLAVGRAYWQKTYGFNSKELYFLYELGGAKTHVIWSGVRYFSYFTDAANFGVHMAMAILAFGISYFSIKNRFLKLYFILIIVAAFYGMAISGTRAALAIPVGGLLFYILLARNFRTFLTSVFILACIFLFFRFTTIGSGNEYIRKMRSAFTPKSDASYNLRVVNREIMKGYMANKPFGYGLGLGGKGERFHPKETLPIPPDSWLINVWTDTGVFGLIIYIFLHIALFAWCSWILMFKIMNKKLRNLLAAWLCVNAGFYISSYANDVMQYPNMIVIFTGFALCFAGTAIDKKEELISNEKITS